MDVVASVGVEGSPLVSSSYDAPVDLSGIARAIATTPAPE